MFWELAQSPEWQEKLRLELRAKFTLVDGKLPVFNDLVNLPVLDAVVQEALRLHPAAPASLPRETPKGGRMLNGYHVPQGVSLHMTVQR